MNITHAELLEPATVRIGWWSSQRSVTLPAGTILIPASNLPEGSETKWWVDELPDSFPADDELDGWHRNYGLGLGAEAVVSVSFE